MIDMILGADKMLSSDFPRDVKALKEWVAILEIQIPASTLWLWASLLLSTISSSLPFTSPNSATMNVPTFYKNIFYISLLLIYSNPRASILWQSILSASFKSYC